MLCARILSGCQRPLPDADHYTLALSAPDHGTAQRHCAEIVAPGLRGDCQVAAMEAAAVADPSLCGDITDPLWRDECTFLVAERLWAQQEHDAAVSSCHRTRFSRPCIWHLLQDEAEAAADAPPLRAEARLLPFLDADTRMPDAGMQFWSMWFRLQARADRPIDGVACDGLAQTPACEAGLDQYLHTVLSARKQAGDDVCSGPVLEGWVGEGRVRGSVDRWSAHHCRE